MSFGLKIEKQSKEEIQTKVLRAAKILKIEELLERRPKQLSGGQRQRVAIGRAITRNPKIFLFDEPLSNLDAALRAEMRVEISKLHQQIKTNMIYVTHDQVEAMTLADRIVILNQGNIEQVGTPEEIYTDPANIFVAQFIGTPKMNILEIDEKDIKSEKINYSKEDTQINGSIPRRLVAQCCIDSLKNKESINKLIEVTSSNDNKKISFKKAMQMI